jgi:hypothetical protein
VSRPRLRARLAVALTGAVLAALALPAAGAVPSAPTGALACTPPDPCGWNGEGGLQTQLRTLSTVVEPHDTDEARALYAALLPAPLQVPADPAVGVWLVEISPPRQVDGRPQDDATHWMEGAVQLRAQHTYPDGRVEEGWFPIHYPVTAELWWQLGRAVGLPKLRGSASMLSADGAWVASARPRHQSGGPSILMTWSPADVEDSPEIRLAETNALDPLYTLIAPFEGPEVHRVQYTVAPPAPPLAWVPDGVPTYTEDYRAERGLVQLRLTGDVDAANADPKDDLPDLFPAGTSLADLVDLTQTVPGVKQDVAVTLGSTSERIASGGYDH